MAKTDFQTSSVATFSSRLITVHATPLQKSVRVHRPEQVVLRFDIRTTDVGALCYLRRSSDPRIAKALRTDEYVSPRLVDLDSFKKERRKRVRSLISHASELIETKGYNHQGARQRIVEIIRFFDWADTNGFAEVMTDIAKIYPAVREYIESIKQRFEHNAISRQTAAVRIAGVLKSLSDWLDLHDLHRGISLVSMKNIPSDRTPPPSDDDLSRAEALCFGIFNGFSALVLNNESYPYKLELPKYLAWEHNWIWVFPTNRVQWIPPYLLSKRETLRHPQWAYDYSNGCVAEHASILEEYFDSWSAKKAIKDAKRNIANANADGRSRYRIREAMHAHDAFMHLFIAQTGINMSIAADLPWGGKYSTATAQQGFRAIKWRAGGKPYHAVVRSTFLPNFKQYIKLREWILDGRQCTTLFFSLGHQHSDEPRRTAENCLSNFFRVLRVIDPTLPNILARKLRAAKDDFHLRHDGIEITSSIMQRSVETTRKKYAAGSKTTHYREFSSFFDKVAQAAFNKKTIQLEPTHDTHEVKGALGSCQSFQHPKPLDDQSPIQPDCKDQEGCLFCRHHRVVADECDIRKLLSAAYVIHQVIVSPRAEAHFNAPLRRIQSILDEISTIPGKASLVERITQEVQMNGELDPYWAEKSSLLISLGFTG